MIEHEIVPFPAFSMEDAACGLFFRSPHFLMKGENMSMWHSKILDASRIICPTEESSKGGSPGS